VTARREAKHVACKSAYELNILKLYF